MLIVYIHNDGTGDKDTGNYDYKVQINHTVIHEGRVEGFPRGQGAGKLIAEVADDIAFQNLEEVSHAN
jgi:hypothetical protein